MRMFSLSRVVFQLIVVIGVGAVLSGCSIPFRAKPVAGLQVSTTNGSSIVMLNGEEKGTTPFSDQQLQPGKYSLKLVPENDELPEFETTVELFKGTLSVVEWNWGSTGAESGGVVIEVEPIQSGSSSELSISSNPDGAIVKVDDTSQGFTPVLMKSVTAGAHRYSVSLPGYIDQSHTVTAIDGFRMNISLLLAKEPENEVDEEEESEDAQATESASVATSSASLKKTPTPSPKKSSAADEETPVSTKSASTAKSGTVTILETGTGWLRVRETPNTSGKELAKVDVGESFPSSKTENGWYEIEYEDGKTGWVIGTYVKKN